MTRPRSGAGPTGGLRPTTSCWSWRKARPWRTSVMHKFHDRDLLAERKIVPSTLEASTPIMVFKNEACGLRVDNTISINWQRLAPKKKKKKPLKRQDWLTAVHCMGGDHRQLFHSFSSSASSCVVTFLGCWQPSVLGGWLFFSRLWILWFIFISNPQWRGHFLVTHILALVLLGQQATGNCGGSYPGFLMRGRPPLPTLPPLPILSRALLLLLMLMLAVWKTSYLSHWHPHQHHRRRYGQVEFEVRSPPKPSVMTLGFGYCWYWVLQMILLCHCNGIGAWLSHFYESLHSACDTANFPNEWQNWLAWHGDIRNIYDIFCDWWHMTHMTWWHMMPWDACSARMSRPQLGPIPRLLNTSFYTNLIIFITIIVDIITITRDGYIWVMTYVTCDIWCHDALRYLVSCPACWTLPFIPTSLSASLWL